MELRYIILLLILGTSIAQASIPQKLREKLGIPKDARSILVIGQAAHLDWDWLNYFTTNVNNTPPDATSFGYWNWDPTKTPQPTNTIFPEVTNLLSYTPGRYGYHIAETSFIERFSQDFPGQWKIMKSFNPDTFSVVGGGLVSPDNLLPESEAFIRNYLVGMIFLKAQGLVWSGTLWLPDDFGHDSQFPVIVNALGVRAISFARLPGSCHQGQDNTPPGFTSAHHILLDPQVGGINFIWEANDGSPTMVYYMPQHYCAGDYLNSRSCEANSPLEASTCKCSVSASTPSQHIQTWINVRKPVSDTPYMYVATGCDFAMPVKNAVKAIDEWNTKSYPSTGVYAVSSQFDKYVDLIEDFLTSNTSAKLKVRNYHGKTPQTTFRPTPYWTGYYSSRPSLKNTHYQSSRLLVSSESLLLIVKSLGLTTSISQKRLDAVWTDLAPSTHHDFITGTATDYVTEGEQYPLMEKIILEASSLKENLLLTLAKGEAPQPGNSSLLVFNPNGFSVTGLVEIPPSIKFPGKTQRLSSGSSLAILEAPPLGYKIYSSIPSSSSPPVTVKQVGRTVTLSNQFLEATINSETGWSISSLLDKKTGKNILTFGNLFQWRYDKGNIYRYGFEEGCGFDLYNVKFTSFAAKIKENGPIRATVECTFQIEATKPVPLDPQNYTIVYSLVQNEPLVRMTLTGAAAGISSVITSFKFSSSIPSYEHGTTYHWDTKEPFQFGKQKDFLITMEATHDHILPLDSNRKVQGAIYHAASPSWGVINDTIYGVLLRNSPGGTPGCNGYGADGSDELVHTIAYAVRIPSGLSPSASGQPQKEARALYNPLSAAPISSSAKLQLPPSFSVASIQEPSPVFLTAAKAGTFNPSQTFLRLYNPTNKEVDVAIHVAPELKMQSVSFATALESANGQPMGLHRTFKTSLKHALTTLQLSP